MWDLVKRAQAREQEAFGELYDIFASRIYRFIRIKVNAPERAEDILQDTFLRAWQSLPRLKLDNLYFGAWLYTIARNLINDHYRNMQRRPAAENIDDHGDLISGDDVAANTELKLDIERMRASLAELSPTYRQVLELRFIQEFSVDETAKILGRNSLSVRVVQHRAIKKLQKLLSDNEKYASA